MVKLLAFALALSFDSFVVSIALGMLELARSTRRNLVVLFALCDGLASLAGFILSERFVGTERLWFGKFQPFVLCLCLLVIFAMARYAPIVRLNHRSTNILYVLPFLLSLDNFVAGISLNQPAVALPVFPLILGLASAPAAWFGLQFGLLARRHLPIRALQFARANLLFFVAALKLL